MTAQNQFRFGLSPQPQLAVMHWPVFGFGPGIFFCVSYGENTPGNGASAMGCLPHLPGRRADAGGIFGQGAFLQWICFHALK